MKKLLLMKGLPCSGKTTWANEWVRKGRKRVRISWTEMLAMTGNRSRRDAMPLAMDAAVRMMCQSLRQGFDVVLDEENLLPPYFSIFMVRAKNLGAQIEWQTMKTPVDECKRRNALKEHPAVELEIERKAERFDAWLKKK